MAKALALVCLLFIAAVSATETEAETERPTVKPIIVGVVPRAGSKYLKVVIVPKGDPRARPAAAANPFLPQTPFLRSTPFGELTLTQLLASMPGLSSSKGTTVLPFMNAAMKEAEINTCARAAAFLAQLGHESGSLVYMEEIASGAAYEGRRDLGNTQPGDGVRFKGRGPIQLTGRANYQAAGRALGLDLIGNPKQVATYAVGFRTSAWFWKSKGLNALADQGKFTSVTQIINGGQNGAADRMMRWGKAKSALACEGAADPFPGCTARRGKCQIGTCAGTVVRGLCGAGAETCCVPNADPFPGCTAKGGKCQTSTCSGTIVRGLCGAGAETCCVPKLNAAPVLRAAQPALGARGLDISQPLKASTAACFKTSKYEWLSIRAGRSNGAVDSNAVNSLKVAAAAGFTPAQLSVYIFPFSNTADASSGGRQVKAMWDSLSSVSGLFGTIWLDVEAAAWRSTTQNQKFFESMVAACKATGKRCGVYTSKVYWTQIMGPTYTGGSALPLWYPHYQRPPTEAMSDFSAFGGWSQPWGKQFQETATVCGMGADINVMNAAWTPSPNSPLVLKNGAPAAASITRDQLLKCMKGLSTAKADAVLSYMNAAMAEAQINTCRRKSAFIAQLGHESGSLNYMEEIASGAKYEGRRDLGNTQPGDGKRFKGRGPIQLTGRANYANAGKALGLDLVGNPTQVATYPVGFRTSAWFWKANGLNALADKGDFAGTTRVINGGTNGAADRNARYAVARRVFGC